MASASFDSLLAAIRRVQRTVWAVFLGANALHAGQLIVAAILTLVTPPRLDHLVRRALAVEPT